MPLWYLPVRTVPIPPGAIAVHGWRWLALAGGRSVPQQENVSGSQSWRPEWRLRKNERYLNYLYSVFLTLFLHLDFTRLNCPKVLLYRTKLGTKIEFSWLLFLSQKTFDAEIALLKKMLLKCKLSYSETLLEFMLPEGRFGIDFVRSSTA